MPIISKGSVSIIDSSGNKKKIHGVFYIHGVKINLFYVGKLTNIGYKDFFESKQCIIYQKNKASDVLLRGIRDSCNNLYKVVHLPN